MPESNLPQTSQLWRNLVDAEQAFVSARMALIRSGADITTILGEALQHPIERGTALRLLAMQPEEVRRNLFPTLIDLAAVSHGDIQLVRDVILSIDRQWLADHVRAEVDRTLDSAQEFEEYRRLAELLVAMDSPHLVDLVARAAASNDPDIQEVAEDFGSSS